MTRVLQRLFLISSLASAAACGSLPEEDTPPVEPDVGLRADAGIDPDMGEAVDASMAADGGEAADGGAPPTSHEARLAALGVDTNLGPPVDENGVARPADYNPLGQRRFTFQPVMELYTAGYSPNEGPCAGRQQCLMEDGQSAPYAPLFASTDDAWVSARFKNVIGADVDGDGLDEIVLVFYASADQALRIKVIDRNDGQYSEEPFRDIATGIESLPQTNSNLHPDLAAGDFDDDGTDEIVVGFSSLYVVKFMGTSMHTVQTRDYPTTTDIYVAAGDLNGDGDDEIAVTSEESGFAYLDVFDDNLTAEPLVDARPLFARNIDGGHQYTRDVRVKIGDIDGDKIDELVFNGVRSFVRNVTAMDDALTGFAWLDMLNQVGFGGQDKPTLELLDYDGDKRLDIFASRWVFRYAPGTNIGSTGTNCELIQEVFNDAPSDMASGDVDGDGLDELLYFYNNQVWIGGRDSTGNHAHQWVRSGTGNNPQLCAANVDDDSPMVEFVTHELQFTDPQILAVMAAPPMYEGIGQNAAPSGTSFGRSNASGVERTASLGITVGFSIGVEWTAPFNVAKASFKTVFETSMDYASSRAQTLEKSIAYSGGAGEDKVVFMSIPFDVYFYRIVSSPAPEQIGSLFTANIPRDMQTLSVSRSFYNAHVPEDQETVDAAVFEHRIGDPRSYPSPSDRDALLARANSGLQSMEASVGVGEGLISVGIQQSESQGMGVAFGISVRFEAEVGAGSVVIGASRGFRSGYEVTFSNTRSTAFQGTVGDIPADAYTSERAYNFGLFVYPQSLGDQRFTVLNYWVR